MAKRGKRQSFNLTCTVCQQRNYVMEKSVINTTEKLSFSKHCKWCRKHTDHAEKKLPNPKPRQ